jgi:polysaccharide biosynthesis/export protein
MRLLLAKLCRRKRQEGSMAKEYSRKSVALPLFLACAFCLFAMGCKGTPLLPPDVPNELNKVAQPEYTIAPPDILLVDAVNLIPRPPYRIAPLDGLLIRVTLLNPPQGQKIDELVPGQPINGLYRVEVSGDVNLGFDYGSVNLARLTIPEAKETITKRLKLRFAMAFDVNVALVESRALQQIRGEHLVRQDGKVMLGIYGSVFVAGMTVDEAKQAIQTQLTKYLFEPEVSVDVSGYNSKVYYIIIDQGESGQLISRWPVTGNETVLDAISQIKGLPLGSDRKKIWVARRCPAGHDYEQMLPVDWDAVASGGSTTTNYQLQPGDRLYVSQDCFVHLDQFLAKIIAPVERVLGVTLLGTSTVQTVAQGIHGNNTNGTTP